METASYRTWVELDSRLLAANFRVLRGAVKPGTQFMAVLKGNAWGLGMLACARVLVAAGVDWLGVTTVEDATTLREENPEVPLLLLCEVPFGQIDQALQSGAQLTLANLEYAEQVSRAATRLGRTIHVHIKINTGLNRIGVRPGDALAFVEKVSRLPGLSLKGIFTHFSCADKVDDLDFSRRQLSEFLEAVTELNKHGFHFDVVHAANSAACIALPESHLDMVRVGMSLVGLYPGPGFEEIVPLQSPLTWKTRIVQILPVEEGEAVGYGAKYRCVADTTIATASVGFADGLTKNFLKGGRVLIRGELYPVVAISMDMTMIDLGREHAELRLGEEVVVLGRQGQTELNARRVAAHIGVDVEELLCGIDARVSRICR